MTQSAPISVLLTIEDINAIIGMGDVTVRTQGLQAAQEVLYIVSKLQQAVQNANEEEAEEEPEVVSKVAKAAPKKAAPGV